MSPTLECPGCNKCQAILETEKWNTIGSAGIILYFYKWPCCKYMFSTPESDNATLKQLGAEETIKCGPLSRLLTKEAMLQYSAVSELLGELIQQRNILSNRLYVPPSVKAFLMESLQETINRSLAILEEIRAIPTEEGGEKEGTITKNNDNE